MLSPLGLLHLALILAVVVLCVRLALGRAGSIRETVGVWRDLGSRPFTQRALWIWSLVFVVDLIETSNDGALSTLLGLDFTPAIARFECGAAGAFQSLFASVPLSWLLALAYTVLFPGLLFGLAHAYDRRKDPQALLEVVFAYGINYLAVLPFYLLFPVTEPWSCAGSGVVALTDLHLSPALQAVVRPMSGIDNCFPSYHTSLMVSLMAIALRYGPRPLAWFTSVAGVLVVLSTVYLGFHWFVDVAAGIAWGLAVVPIGRRIAQRMVNEAAPAIA